MILRVLFLSFLLFAGVNSKPSSESKNFDCWITSSNKTYKLGEVPQIEVFIKNNTKKDIYLIGSLDASEEKWRGPHCYFIIESPAPINKEPIGRCGNMNSIKPEDFILVKSGGVFNPYQKGFFGSYQISSKENFKIPGTYRITFYYSTKSEKLEEYFGDDYDIDKDKIRSLFSKVPHVELKSNTLSITIKK